MRQRRRSGKAKRGRLKRKPCDARFVKPLDEECVASLAKEHILLVSIEENVKSGGFGERVLDYVSRMELACKVVTITLPDDYIEHGSVDMLRKRSDAG